MKRFEDLEISNLESCQADSSRLEARVKVLEEQNDARVKVLELQNEALMAKLADCLGKPWATQARLPRVWRCPLDLL